MKAIMNDEVMERLIDTLMELQKKESTDLPLLKKQLAETEKGINNMLNAIQAGIFTPSTKQRLDELEETKRPARSQHFAGGNAQAPAYKRTDSIFHLPLP